MNILIFDTSTSVEFVILHTNNDVRIKVKNASSDHSALLFENIHSLLDEVKLSISEINAIAVGIGPGSFTGIRIAVSTARMLAQVLSIPLIGIKTHEMFAESASNNEGSYVLVAFDAKKKRVFGALYRIENGNAHEVVSCGDYAIETLLNSCPIDARLCAIGNGAQNYFEQITAAIKNTVFLSEFTPDAKKISDMIIKKLEKDDSFDYKSVVPFYARKPDAVSPAT